MPEEIVRYIYDLSGNYREIYGRSMKIIKLTPEYEGEVEEGVYEVRLLGEKYETSTSIQEFTQIVDEMLGRRR